MKFRYVYEHEMTKEIRFMYFNIRDIERQDFFKRFIENFKKVGFVLISRDRYIQIKDKHHNDIYEHDTLTAKITKDSEVVKGTVFYWGGEYCIEQKSDKFPICSLQIVDVLSLNVIGNMYVDEI